MPQSGLSGNIPGVMKPMPFNQCTCLHSIIQGVQHLGSSLLLPSLLRVWQGLLFAELGPRCLLVLPEPMIPNSAVMDQLPSPHDGGKAPSAGSPSRRHTVAGTASKGMLVSVALLRMSITAAADAVDHADHTTRMADVLFFIVVLLIIAALAMIVAVAFVAGFLVAWGLLQGSRTATTQQPTVEMVRDDTGTPTGKAIDTVFVAAMYAEHFHLRPDCSNLNGMTLPVRRLRTCAVCLKRMD